MKNYLALSYQIDMSQMGESCETEMVIFNACSCLVVVALKSLTWYIKIHSTSFASKENELLHYRIAYPMFVKTAWILIYSHMTPLHIVHSSIKKGRILIDILCVFLREYSGNGTIRWRGEVLKDIFRDFSFWALITQMWPHAQDLDF